MADILTWLGDMLGINKGNATQAAAAQNTNVIKDYGTQANGIIDAGAGASGDWLKKSLGLTGLDGSTLYADALGANGAAGSTRAQDAFTTSPGYQFQLDQGLQALDRRAAASGNLSSGNADIGAMDYASGLAKQGWSDWLANLTGGIDRTRATYSDLANLSSGTAGQKLGVAGDVASGLTAANNMKASGKEANQGWLWAPLQGAASVAGAFMGMNGAKPTGGYTPSFGGYGSF